MTGAGFSIAVPVRGGMTDAERSAAMSQILAECFGNYDARIAVEVAHRLLYAVSDIGADYFFAALDEARAQCPAPQR